MTSEGDAKPRAVAAAAHTVSLSDTPPGAHTLEILLFTTIACTAGASSRDRPISTGAPGSAFRVNMAAKLGVGSSATMSVRFMRASFVGSSAGWNANPPTPTRNPRGRLDRAETAAR